MECLNCGLSQPLIWHMQPSWEDFVSQVRHMQEECPAARKPNADESSAEPNRKIPLSLLPLVPPQAPVAYMPSHPESRGFRRWRVCVWAEGEFRHQDELKREVFYDDLHDALKRVPGEPKDDVATIEVGVADTNLLHGHKIQSWELVYIWNRNLGQWEMVDKYRKLMMKRTP